MSKRFLNLKAKTKKEIKQIVRKHELIDLDVHIEESSFKTKLHGRSEDIWAIVVNDIKKYGFIKIVLKGMIHSSCLSHAEYGDNVIKTREKYRKWAKDIFGRPVKILKRFPDPIWSPAREI